jgi:hypothetical protein
MVGKYLPSEFKSAAGPFDRWPLGRGFQRFYGFLGGDTSQWYPDLAYDNHQVEPPRTPRGGVPPDRGPGGQGHPVHRRRQAGRPAQAVLRPHSITADAEIPAGGAQGVLLCQGSNAGGWTFYVKDGRLCYAHNYVGRATYQVSTRDMLPAGRHQLRFEFEPTDKPDFAHGKGSPGRAQLYVDGQLLAQQQFPVTTPMVFNPGGLTCAANPGSPITADYQAPFRFTGTLHTVTVDLSGDLITDTESEMRMAMARQ